MSARISPLVQKRPISALKDPASPSTALTPRSANAGTPRTPADATPTNPGDSPERAAKRARFEQDQLGFSGGTPGGRTGTPRSPAGGLSVPTPTPLSHGQQLLPPTLGQVGRSSSAGRGGKAWVRDRIAELEEVYKECIMAATLLIQHKGYAKKLGISTALPVHLSQNLEVAWARYGSLRAHIEAYLLQCAQYATSSTKPLPTPSSLVPGLAPLPPTPSTPMTAAHLLSTSGPLTARGRISLDALAAADPAKGLMGYENGEIVFPGVPSDIAVPFLDDVNLGPNSIDLANAGDIPEISISTQSAMPSMDFSGLAGIGELDLNSLGIAELSALINGDAMMGAAAAGMDISGLQGSVGDAQPQSILGGDMAMTPNTMAEADRLLASLGGFTQVPTQQQDIAAQGAVPAPVPTQQAQDSGLTAIGEQNIDTLLASLNQGDQPATIPPSDPNRISIKPDTTGAPNQLSIQTQSMPAGTQDVQPLSAAQSVDFDFSALEGLDGLEGMDNLGDLDFAQFAGLFDGSGKSTRAASPVGLPTAAPQTSAPVDQQQSIQQTPAGGAVTAEQPSVRPQPASIPPPKETGPLPQTEPAVTANTVQPVQPQLSAPPNEFENSLGLDPMYGASGGIDYNQSSAFDADLGGIDMDDFDFGSLGNMPDIGEEEFDSMFAV